MEMSISRSRAVLKWVYSTDCKHMDSQHGMYLFSAQLWAVGSYCGSYIGGTPKNAPLRCNKLSALPLGA